MFNKPDGVYEIEHYEQELKLCPLEGNRFSRRNYACERCDCTQYDETTQYQYIDCQGRQFGYRCPVEKVHAEKEAEDYQKKQKEKLNKKKQIIRDNSNISTFDAYRFLKYCDEVDDYLKKTCQKYTDNMTIFPYCGEGKVILSYIVRKNTFPQISVSENMGALLTKFINIAKEDTDAAFSYHLIPQGIAESVRINMHLRHKIPVAQIRYDDPIYIDNTKINKYIELLYGLKSWDFKKIRQKHLEITEIPNGTKVVYIKQEIDEIVRRKDW